jgi:hypothetical protein
MKSSSTAFSSNQCEASGSGVNLFKLKTVVPNTQCRISDIEINVGDYVAMYLSLQLDKQANFKLALRNPKKMTFIFIYSISL